MIATRNGFEVRCFPVMLSTFSFTDVLPMYKEILPMPYKEPRSFEHGLA